MKLGLIAVSAAAALALGSQTASAQPVIVQPIYSPGISIGGTFYGRGITIGGAYSTGPTIVSPAPAVVVQPRVYAGPVYVPPPVVTVVPRPYYAPYGYYHHHHHYRW